MPRMIPIEKQNQTQDRRSEVLSLPIPITGAVHTSGDGCVVDTRGRPLTDLRISVTDHCNFRCQHCYKIDSDYQPENVEDEKIIITYLRYKFFFYKF